MVTVFVYIDTENAQHYNNLEGLWKNVSNWGSGAHFLCDQASAVDDYMMCIVLLLCGMPLFIHTSHRTLLIILL